MHKKVYAISLDQNLHLKAKERARMDGQSFSGLLSVLLKKHLDEKTFNVKEKK